MRWTGPLPLLADAVVWQRAGDGLEWGELHLSGSGEAWRLGTILVRVDPRHFDFRLAANVRENRTAGPWSVELAPAGAALALNAGQFTDDGPWGWVVHNGREMRPPGMGPLSMALLVAPGGGIRWVTGDRMAEARERGELAGVVEALQSYPTLLSGDGDVPAPLLAAGRGVDLEHRDGRLAIGELRDGRILIALTRFEGLGGALSVLPFGPTVPEMSALMGALGCHTAMMLDGGLSAQLLLRTDSGEEHRWSGLRQVPLGLVAVRKKEADRP
ncbi:MAG: phosphodiester glycosidase family protein [Gemmatimonadaceae bacterium]